MRCLRLILSLLLIPLGSMSQSVSTYFQFEKPLYGAAYYSEYTPTDRLDEDIRLMKQANLSVVRIGESTWSVFEPQNGVFQFEWMDRIIDKLSKAGIKIILGTPPTTTTANGY
jgi:beta-galactosidase